MALGYESRRAERVAGSRVVVAPLRRLGDGAVCGIGLAGAAALLLADTGRLTAYRTVHQLAWDEDVLPAWWLTLLPVAVLGLALAVGTGRRAAAGVPLAAVGVLAYTGHLGRLLDLWTFDGAHDPGLAVPVGLLGSLLVIVAGLSASAGSLQPPGPRLPVRTAGGRPHGGTPPRSSAGWAVGTAAVTAALLGLLLFARDEAAYALPVLGAAATLWVLGRCHGRLPASGLLAARCAALLPPAFLAGDLLTADGTPGLLTALAAVTGLAALAAAVPGWADVLAGVGAEPEAAAARPAIDLREQRPLEGEPTRQLCVAAHLDGALSRQAVREALDEVRGIAPSLGVDFETVARHCLLARHRLLLRDTALAGIALPLALEVTLVEARATHLLLLAVVAVGVAALDRWVSWYRVVGPHLTPGTFPAVLPPGGPAQRSYRPELTPGEERRIAGLVTWERGNVTPYGGFVPFAGSGTPIGGWSFALSVLKEAVPGTEPLALTVDELYAAVRGTVAALGLEGVAIEDRLYADAEDPARRTRATPPVVPRPLGPQADPALVQHLVQVPDRADRVYQCIRVHGWGGEYVLSIYLNISRAGGGLFLEARYFLLLPTRHELYARAERLPSSLPRRVLDVAGAAAAGSVTGLLAAVPRVVSDVRDLTREPGDGEQGVTASVRELAASTAYRRYFQRLDREMTSKIVERQILDTVRDVLDLKHIDTAELTERRTTILNNGVILNGGTFTAENVAVGRHASLVNRLATAVRPGQEN